MSASSSGGIRNTQKEPKRILVTGGAGFLGSHLCERLLENGNEVICLDNFFTGNKRNIYHLMDHASFEVVNHDITAPIFLQVEEIYNLACPASPIHYQLDSVHTMKTSVLGVINMLGMAKRVDARIFQASTSEVYGDPLVHPQNENYWGSVNPIGQRSCYDEGKRAAEALVFDYRRQHDLKVKVVRIFNTYGPRMHPEDGRVVSNFIVQGLKGQPLTIYGDGLQTRSFCYYSDLIDGFLRMMGSVDEVTGPVNLGNPVEFTILELAELIRELIGNEVKLEFKPLPPDDPKQRKPDISLANELLEWQPQIMLKEGLEKTIVYFDQLFSASDASNVKSMFSTKVRKQSGVTAE